MNYAMRQCRAVARAAGRMVWEGARLYRERPKSQRNCPNSVPVHAPPRHDRVKM